MFIFIQMVFVEFGYIIWINLGFKVSFIVFFEFVYKFEDFGVLIIGQSVDYFMFVVINFGMYKYFVVNRVDFYKFFYIEIKVIIIYNIEDIMNYFMKIFIVCVVEECCLIFFGVFLDCMFDVMGCEYVYCYCFDEFVVNIILKNWLGYKFVFYMVKSMFFQLINKYDRVSFKVCNK